MTNRTDNALTTLTNRIKTTFMHQVGALYPYYI